MSGKSELCSIYVLPAQKNVADPSRDASGNQKGGSMSQTYKDSATGRFISENEVISQRKDRALRFIRKVNAKKQYREGGKFARVPDKKGCSTAFIWMVLGILTTWIALAYIFSK